MFLFITKDSKCNWSGFCSFSFLARGFYYFSRKHGMRFYARKQLKRLIFLNVWDISVFACAHGALMKFNNHFSTHLLFKASLQKYRAWWNLVRPFRSCHMYQRLRLIRAALKSSSPTFFFHILVLISPLIQTVTSSPHRLPLSLSARQTWWSFPLCYPLSAADCPSWAAGSRQGHMA